MQIARRDGLEKESGGEINSEFFSVKGGKRSPAPSTLGGIEKSDPVSGIWNLYALKMPLGANLPAHFHISRLHFSICI